MLFYLFLFTLLIALVGALLFWYTIKKFYWGPRGRPPHYRHRGDEEPPRGARRKSMSGGGARD